MFTTIIFLFVFQSEMFDPANILRFADHLYDQHDYNAALQEYRRYKFLGDSLPRETREKIIDCYVQNNRFAEARKESNQLLERNYASYVKGYILYKAQLYDSSRLFLHNVTSPYEKKAHTLIGLGFTQQYNFNDASKYITLPDTAPKHKSISTGALLSLFPGGGHFYCNRIGDGLFSCAVVSLSAALAYYYNSKDEDIKFRISLGAAVLLYAGNIYGGINAVRNYNYYIDDTYRRSVIESIDPVDPFYR